MIIADTSGLLALYVASDPDHERTLSATPVDEALVISPFVLAELDYLLARRLGTEAELAVLHDVAAAHQLAAFGEDDLSQAIGVIERYADQEIGLADASIVVLAERHRTRRILTLDHRHFDVLRPIDGGRFRLLPGR